MRVRGKNSFNILNSKLDWRCLLDAVFLKMEIGVDVAETSETYSRYFYSRNANVAVSKTRLYLDHTTKVALR